MNFYSTIPDESIKVASRWLEQFETVIVCLHTHTHTHTIQIHLSSKTGKHLSNLCLFIIIFMYGTDAVCMYISSSTPTEHSQVCYLADAFSQSVYVLVFIVFMHLSILKTARYSSPD